MSDWKQWLEEELDCGTDTIPRHQILRRFVSNGLLPFLRRHGYEVICSEKELRSEIASGLFKNRNARPLNGYWTFLPKRNEEYLDEDLNQYYFVLSPKKWDIFWSSWDFWPDICDEELGWARREEIQKYIWEQIDIERSIQTTTVTEYVQGGEEAEDVEYGRRLRNPKEDVYLKEASESNEWGGYRR